ncbi:OmpA family protein [Maribius pontilimi]|uniref:OmpA family protein n=1 Tax=Palleronia pontilimi TaxID=1964209 RepID=A0A934M977_9RHOB|nr:OmpA family protein [Palleronia pontilimi]MBJ3762227.1 OmpA family protein [Palleronia pontilimi]
MRKSLKTTTALVAGLHLAIPQAAFAQDQISLDQLLEVCAELDAETCATATGLPADQVAEALRMAREAGAAETAEPAPEAAEAAPEEAPAAEEVTETEAAEPVEETAEMPEAEAEAEAEAMTAEGEQTQAEPVEGEAAEAAPEPAAVPAEPAAEAAEAAPAEPAPAADAAEAAPAEPATEAEGTVETTAEEQVTDEAPETAETEETPEMVEMDGTPVLTEETGDAAAATEAAPAETAEGEAAPEAEMPAEESPATAEAEAEAAPEDTATAESADAAPEAGEAPETQMTDAERQALEGSEAAPVAAAALDAAPAEEVATETVTEETARSSDEDFTSDIAGEPREASSASTVEAEAADNDDDDGLSTLQKALIAGAGIIAVGTLLNNNRQVVASSEDRVVVSGRDGGYELIKDDTALLRRPGTEVSTERFDDGSTRTTVLRPDGSQIVTIRDANLRVLQRVRVTPEGDRIVLIDDTIETQAVDVSTLRPAARSQVDAGMDEDALRQALAAEGAFDRSFSLAQVRNISQVREQVPAVDLDNITFASGSAAIAPEQADELTDLGSYIRARIAENPQEIFLVEGHTDAVGNAAYNLALSDRRAESVALALTEYFDVPPENLVVQGYGERFLKVPTTEAERQNRRATVRRITPLLQTASAQ